MGCAPTPVGEMLNVREIVNAQEVAYRRWVVLLLLLLLLLLRRRVRNPNHIIF